LKIWDSRDETVKSFPTSSIITQTKPVGGFEFFDSFKIETEIAGAEEFYDISNLTRISREVMKGTYFWG